MSNVETTRKPKESRADHYLIDAAGNVVEDVALATGIRYVNLVTKRAFDYQVPGVGEPLAIGSPALMGGLFGFKTLAINTASGIRNNRDNPGSPDDEDAGLVDRFAAIVQGDWGAERGGGRVIIDLELLVSALKAVFKRERKPFDDATEAKYKAKLESDEAYRKQVFGLDAVKAQYLILRAEKSGKGTAGIMLE